MTCAICDKCPCECVDLEYKLMYWAEKLKRAENHLLIMLREDAKIAENMRDVWANQQAGSE